MKMLQTAMGLIALLVASPAWGDIVAAHSEEVDFSQGYLMADGSLYNGPNAAAINAAVSSEWATFSQTHAVFRFYADVDNPADRVVGLVSFSPAEMRAAIISPASSDFFDPATTSLLTPSVLNMASQPLTAFDSWVTVGAASFEEAQTGEGISIGGPLPTTFVGGFFVPSNGAIIATAPTLLSGAINPITIPDAENRVLYAQVTVPRGTFFDFDGTLIYRPNGTGAELWAPIEFRSVTDTGGLPCPADADGDGKVGIVDFLAVLAEWGTDCAIDPCTTDGDGDGTIGITDFLNVLAEWGTCP